MYKIYISDSILLLTSEAPTATTPATPVYYYMGKKKMILQIADQLEKANYIDTVYLVHHDLEELFQDFCATYTVIEAAGGVIYNSDRQLLVMYRRGYLDLPKGKLDANETPRIAAQREVVEETGIIESALTCNDLIHTMYHTYRLGKKHILKRTYWFDMQCNQTAFKPQTEEDIDWVEWMTPEQVQGREEEMHRSIKDMLTELKIV